jgi:hypothetical protein
MTYGVEGGVGAYPLGLQGPKAGFLPYPGLYLRNDSYYFHGKISQATFGGDVYDNVRISQFVDFLHIKYVSSCNILGAHYGVGVILPFVDLDMKSGLRSSIPGFIPINTTRHQSDNNFGDLVVYPVILGWHFDCLHIATSLAAFIPTGEYQLGNLANAGKNYLALDPGIGFTYQMEFEEECGFEFSNWSGFTFNFKNDDTDYTSGIIFHSEFYAGFYNECGLQYGAVAYLADQLTNDRGSGAVLGSFKGHKFGFGPSLSYNFSMLKLPVAVKARYYFDVAANDYQEGGTLFFTLSFPLWSQGCR